MRLIIFHIIFVPFLLFSTLFCKPNNIPQQAQKPSISIDDILNKVTNAPQGTQLTPEEAQKIAQLILASGQISQEALKNLQEKEQIEQKLQNLKRKLNNTEKDNKALNEALYNVNERQISGPIMNYMSQARAYARQLANDENKQKSASLILQLTERSKNDATKQMRNPQNNVALDGQEYLARNGIYLTKRLMHKLGISEKNEQRMCDAFSSLQNGVKKNRKQIGIITTINTAHTFAADYCKKNKTGFIYGCANIFDQGIEKLGIKDPAHGWGFPITFVFVDKVVDKACDKLAESDSAQHIAQKIGLNKLPPIIQIIAKESVKEGSKYAGTYYLTPHVVNGTSKAATKVGSWAKNNKQCIFVYELAQSATSKSLPYVLAVSKIGFNGTKKVINFGFKVGPHIVTTAGVYKLLDTAQKKTETGKKLTEKIGFNKLSENAQELTKLIIGFATWPALKILWTIVASSFSSIIPVPISLGRII